MTFINSLRVFIIKHFSLDRKIFYVVFGNINSVEKGAVPFSQKDCKYIYEVCESVSQILRQLSRLNRAEDFKLTVSLNVFNDSTSTETNNYVIETTDFPQSPDEIIQNIENWDNETKKNGVLTYYEQNKEKILLNALEHYETNKEEINKKRKEKIICETCGGKYTVNNRAVHNRTNKHLKYSTPPPLNMSLLSTSTPDISSSL